MIAKDEFLRSFFPKKRTRVSRRLRAEAQKFFGDVNLNFDVKVAIKYKNATNIIEKYRTRLLRTRPHNKMCVITQKPLSDVETVFVRIQKNGFARGYCANSLAQYAATVEFPADPVTRVPITSVELRRLARLVPRYRRKILIDRVDMWKSIFVGSTLEFLISLMPLMSTLQAHFNSSLLILLSEETGDSIHDHTISSFFCQATYLYTISKPKYRHVKSRFLDACDNSVVAKDTLLFLDSICFNMFKFHDIRFAFQGDRAVPILISHSVPRNLA